MIYILDAEEYDLWEVAWMPLLQGIAEFCTDRRKQVILLLYCCCSLLLPFNGNINIAFEQTISVFYLVSSYP